MAKLEGAKAAAAASGTIWTGTGLSLGLGLGLGAVGPAIVGALAAITGYRYCRRRQNRMVKDTELEDSIAESSS